MVSIRKYLEMRGPGKPDQAESPGSPVLVELCSSIIDHIGAYVLTGDAGSELRGRLESAKASLQTQTDSEGALRVEDAVRGALAGYAAREREAAQRIAVETQHVVGVLNHALMVLTGGSERSVSRLQGIQESLQRTSRIRDVEGLRASLSDAMKLIREESAREQEHAARDLASFESEVIKVREQIAANPVRRLPGRTEAIQALSDSLLTVKSGSSLFTIAFSFDGIRSIVQRYGQEPVDELFFQVVRERVQPISSVNTSWRWSPGSVVSIFERPGELERLRSELAELCRAPLVYRMTLGNRTAVLKVGVSHLIAVASTGTLPTLVAELDRFSGTEAQSG